MKNLVRNPSYPEAHLASSATCDAAATFFNLAGKQRYDFTADVAHRCVLSVPQHDYTVTDDELRDLRWEVSGYAVDRLSVRAFHVAHIMGVHFRAGEWIGHPRCGSVVSCVKEGRSLYARVLRFLKVDHDECPGYASVKWFSNPEYPHDTPLVPVVTTNGHDLDYEYGSIIRITTIDPSAVSVGRNPTNELFYMMRESGYDTCTAT